jgi:hypothetical protein
VEREKEKSNHQVAGRVMRWIRELEKASKRPAVPHRRLRGNVVRPSPCRRRMELKRKEEGMFSTFLNNRISPEQPVLATLAYNSEK